MIESGHCDALGPTAEAGGVNFAVCSSEAEAVDLVLFDRGGAEAATHRLPARTGNVWHGFLPGCPVGQTYGFRAHGLYAPERALRFNPHKLLLDPYAREIRGGLEWRPEIFDYASFEPTRGLIQSTSDSAPFVPKAVVHGTGAAAGGRPRRPAIPWAETVIYEVNVRGYTMLHPAVDEADRGTFRGMRHREVLDYLKALGITSIELMPVHAFVDEEFLVAHGLRNYWGYNTLGFFAPAGRLAGDHGPASFREMVDAIHDAGLEVILDVVYNHTAEGGRLGPTLSFRGLDNAAYYRLHPEDLSEYVNDTGVGNTIDAEQPVVQRLILDSLRYWSADMGVDGFRFDLATILGRRAHGFDSEHPLLAMIGNDAELQHVKLIAEPWDVGPSGYRLGAFPQPWSEWNDRFRDAARQFWRGDPGLAPEFARRLHGSSDIFEGNGRGPQASVNFVAAHDGFTLADCVTYARRHNEANQEGNRDGHGENFSCNHGVEGETDDPEVVAARRRHRLNLLASVLVAQGTPMLLAGDEFGNSQRGNNNAYAQDNEIGWLDWPRSQADAAFTAEVRQLLRLRRQLPLLRQSTYRHGAANGAGQVPDIFWFRPDGAAMDEADWPVSRVFALLLTDGDARAGSEADAVAVLINGGDSAAEFRLPPLPGLSKWRARYATGHEAPGRNLRPADGAILCGTEAQSITVLSSVG